MIFNHRDASRARAPYPVWFPVMRFALETPSGSDGIIFNLSFLARAREREREREREHIETNGKFWRAGHANILLMKYRRCTGVSKL